jgi:hypothetical protein
MKLIFIYGPPASGKLTIAEIVSARTGIPLFHNHISRDLVKDIYGDELKKHYALVTTIRLDVIEYCGKTIPTFSSRMFMRAKPMMQTSKKWSKQQKKTAAKSSSLS